MVSQSRDTTGTDSHGASDTIHELRQIRKIANKMYGLLYRIHTGQHGVSSKEVAEAVRSYESYWEDH